MGTYPVFLHGERAGVLETLREGLLTRFWASIPGASGLVRLSVYGEDREGYLGVMRPEREGLTLSRAMSRSAMSVFPKAIEYAAPSGDRRREEPAPAAPSAAPAERLGSEEDMLWYSAPDGTLSCFDGARLWIALPAEGARLPGNAEQLKKRIGGREYIVFPRKIWYNNIILMPRRRRLMQMSDLITKKRDGGSLSTGEIDYMIQGYTAGSIPDYQMSAMLMAIVWRGMDRRETLDLTMSMMRSGDTLDLSSISGVKADKHSTGGVGDKTSLALLPMVAAQGIRMAKMSGRGLGHTGGTIDKLESFPGFSTSLTLEKFLANVESVGFAIAGQTADLDPADKKLYALRDVTGTVPAIPLIVSSIMSKKLAAGADVIVLDVKCGSGSFMKTEEDARTLATEMVEIGKLAGRRTIACITDMDEPLGSAVGNALEVKEAIALLKGEFGGNLLELCLTLGSCILTAAGAAGDDAEAREKLERGISDGSALEKLAEFVGAQGGDERAVYDVSLLPQAHVMKEVPSPSEGYVNHICAEDVGRVSMHLGGGRATKESNIDLSVGIVLHRKVGDYVKRGESLATIHAPSPVKAEEAAGLLADCYRIGAERPEKRPFIKAIIR